jgi:hypothetical protein
MKGIFATAFIIVLISFTLVACEGAKENIVTDMVEDLTALRVESYQLGDFNRSEVKGEAYHSAAIFRNKEEIGNLTIIEKDGKFGGAVMKSDFIGMYPESFAIQILRDIGISEKNIERMRNDVIYASELEQLKSLDLNGYRIMGATIIEEETQETVFELYILDRKNVKGYEENKFQTFSLLE